MVTGMVYFKYHEVSSGMAPNPSKSQDMWAFDALGTGFLAFLYVALFLQVL